MENAVLPSPFQNITKIHLVKAVNKLETFNKKHMHSAAVVFSSNTADIEKKEGREEKKRIPSTGREEKRRKEYGGGKEI